jgi:UDP-glucose 6-dehydrogenase
LVDDLRVSEFNSVATLVGVGKLGVCASLVYANAGYEVVGVDVSRDHVDALNAKTYRSSEPLVNEYLAACTTFRASTNLLESVGWAEVVMLFVDTPSGPDEKVYDHRNVSNVLHTMVRRNLLRARVLQG